MRSEDRESFRAPMHRDFALLSGSAADISCLVIPEGCVGLSTLAALEQGIAVVAVKENRNGMRNDPGALGFGD